MTANPLDASVIVPSHRGAHRLPALLEALARQDHPGPWEVLVVLDGVLDDSPDVLESWQGRLPLRVLRSEEPRGVVAALNDGFAAARGRVLIRCDDDLTPVTHMVRGHVEHHHGRDDLGVSCAMRDVVTDTPYARTYGLAANRRRLEQWYTRPPGLRWVDWSAHNSVTRTAWGRLEHGFDPRFVYGQDSELGYRLMRSGVTIVVDPALEVEHRGAALSAANGSLGPTWPGRPGRSSSGSTERATPRPTTCRHRRARGCGPLRWAHSSGACGTGRRTSAWGGPSRCGLRACPGPAEPGWSRSPPRRPAAPAGCTAPGDLSTLTTQKGRELARERQAPEPPVVG